MLQPQMLATLPDCITSGDACVFPSGSLTPKRIVDGALIDCKLDSLRERASVTFNVLMNRLSRSAAVPQIGLILRPNAKNYGHCLAEALPALYLLNAAGFDPPIVVPETATLPFMREVLACYPRLRFHFMSPGEAIRAKVGFYIAAPFSRSIEESILPNARFLADTLGVKPGDGPRRIHVTRSGRRRIANEPELAGLLARFGFVTADFASMNVAEQIRFCRNGEVMLAGHGAGIANSIFMKPGAIVIEAASPVSAPQDTYYSELCRKTAKRYFALRGLRVNHAAPPDRNEDFRVDPYQLETLLETLLPQPSAQA